MFLIIERLVWRPVSVEALPSFHLNPSGVSSSEYVPVAWLKLKNTEMESSYNQDLISFRIFEIENLFLKVVRS